MLENRELISLNLLEILVIIKNSKWNENKILKKDI
jgi:hypothetical protein